MPTLYCYLKSPGVTERRDGSLGLRDDDDDDDGDERCKTYVKMEGKTNISRHLAITGCPEPGLLSAQCLKIIELGCNLKQFLVEADRKCIFHFQS